jgi:pyruvate/2-oxoglutarate dehydrogenase complex dihydrolipoamide acyltransferase (E2) component
VKIDIVVPQVGEAVSEVTLVRWLKGVGDAVKAGEPLFVVDTDKSGMEVEAADDGILSEIRAPDGSSVMPLDVVGVLDADGAGS